MKNKVKNYLSCFCLVIYLLFGFLNTGCVGICAGIDDINHFGLNIFGYETCYHENPAHAQCISTANANLSTSDYNDIFALTSVVSQEESTGELDLSFINMFTTMPHLIVYYINYLDKPIVSKVNQDFITQNLEILKNTVLLI